MSNVCFSPVCVRVLSYRVSGLIEKRSPSETNKLQVWSTVTERAREGMKFGLAEQWGFCRTVAERICFAFQESKEGWLESVKVRSTIKPTDFS